MFPEIVPVRTCLCSRFLSHDCVCYTQSFHIVSLNFRFDFRTTFKYFQEIKEQQKTRSRYEVGFPVMCLTTSVFSRHTVSSLVGKLFIIILFICHYCCHYFDRFKVFVPDFKVSAKLYK